MDTISTQPQKLTSYPNLSDVLLSEKEPVVNIPCPPIKSRDQRCSHGCIRNWTMFGEKPPVYQLCYCSYKIFQYKR